MSDNDVVTRFGNSVLQHGKYNDRIYLMKLSYEDFPAILGELGKLASSGNYSKIFAKVPSFAKDGFVEDGYSVEAFVPKFFGGHEDAYFMGKYFSKSRMVDRRMAEIKRVLETAMAKAGEKKMFDTPRGFSVGLCNKSDAVEMADLYRTVFQTYPFPIVVPEYISKMMDENIAYFKVCKDGSIVALSSSEMDVASRNVEMTDFATVPEYRCSGIATCLLRKMEDEMKNRGIKVAYTIARAFSYGMNIVFSRAGYEFGGTLINNTNISGRLESMNVWYKFLADVGQKALSG